MTGQLERRAAGRSGEVSPTHGDRDAEGREVQNYYAVGNQEVAKASAGDAFGRVGLHAV